MTKAVDFLPTTRDASSRIPLVIAFLLFGFVIIRTAWVSDDAYITLRTVDNFVHGYGLTWNVAERVQSYTHPLWLFALSAVYSVTHAPYLTVISLSLVVSLAAAALVFFVHPRTVPDALLAATILVSSKAYIDYSTSGLENPMTHLLLAGFLVVYYRQPPSLKRAFYLSLLGSLGLLNRMDTALLFAPVLLVVLLQSLHWRTLGVMTLGQLPFVLWEVFSLIYYGFPFPNTAYSKILLGDLGQTLLWQQGLYYVANSIQFDPLTLVIIASAVILAFMAASHKSIPVAIGIILYILYTVSIGGDFMSGRFFAAPLLAAVMILSTLSIALLSSASIVFVFLAVIGLGLAAPHPTLLTSFGDSVEAVDAENAIRLGTVEDNRGIADERAFYYSHTGLLRRSRYNPIPSFVWWDRIGRRIRAETSPIIVEHNVGFIGFYAGREKFIVDTYGLTDPLLARLPPIRTVGWRIGHLDRVVPEGYVETLLTGENQLADPNLARYYEQLALIVRGPLFDPLRLRAIWSMNLGAYDSLIDFNAYRYPDMRHLRAAEISNERSAAQPITLSDSGMEVVFDELIHAATIELSVQPDNAYQVIYFKGSMKLATQTIPYTYTGAPFAIHTLALPKRVRAQGIDRLWILPTTAHGERYIGHLRLDGS